MKAEISFDTDVEQSGQENIEGCYRIEGGQWQVFYFTQWWEGQEPSIKHGVWRSGVAGVEVRYSKDKALNKSSVIEELSRILGVAEWSEVRGPDSLRLK